MGMIVFKYLHSRTFKCIILSVLAFMSIILVVKSLGVMVYGRV